MPERMFGSRASVPRDDDATARVADLCESIIDEVARPRHDWMRMRRLAGELARTASAMAQAQSRRPSRRG